MRFLPSARGRAQRAQARFEILVASHDSTAALADEELDLQIDGRSLVVGTQPEVATIADDQLAARERVADLGRRPAIDVDPVEHGDHALGPVDRRTVGRADLAVELAPRLDPLAAVG